MWKTIPLWRPCKLPAVGPQLPCALVADGCKRSPEPPVCLPVSPQPAGGQARLITNRCEAVAETVGRDWECLMDFPVAGLDDFIQPHILAVPPPVFSDLPLFHESSVSAWEDQPALVLAARPPAAAATECPVCRSRFSSGFRVSVWYCRRSLVFWSHG